MACCAGRYAPEIVEKPQRQLAVASPDLQSKIKNNGGDPIVMGPKEFDYLQKDINRWSGVTRPLVSSRNREH
jgi:hypothetical protein